MGSLKSACPLSTTGSKNISFVLGGVDVLTWSGSKQETVLSTAADGFSLKAHTDPSPAVFAAIIVVCVCLWCEFINCRRMRCKPQPQNMSATNNSILNSQPHVSPPVLLPHLPPPWTNFSRQTLALVTYSRPKSLASLIQRCLRQQAVKGK